ncbi:MAG: YraN family protein [bacterium]
MQNKSIKKIGKFGEEMAAEFLRNKNYEIIERNYRWARGEIDIVAKKDDMLIFVEVKTAQRDTFGPPETWVDQRKQQQIGQVAEHYLQEKEIDDMDCRFDVIAITAQGKEWKIKHIENAFWL